MRSKKVITLMFFTMIFLAACQPMAIATPDVPSAREDKPAPTQIQNTGTHTTENHAIVDSIEIIFLESFPLQVIAVLRGNLPDGCTTILDAETAYEENTFRIQINTQRPDQAMCTMALVPFEENISLDVYGLPAGTYRVIADETYAEFTFTQDNTISTGG